MAEQSPPTGTETAGVRRAKYGLNLLIAALAAIALVVFLNWIAYRQFVRFDLTATRRYSLSEKTQKVLGKLEGAYRIVTLLEAPRGMPRRAELIERVEDLTEEYGRYGADLGVSHIDPGRDIADLERFYGEIHDRFAESLEKPEKRIEAARRTLPEIRKRIPATASPVRALARSEGLGDGRLPRFVESVQRAVQRLQSQLERVESEAEKNLGKALPAYGRVRDSMASLLEDTTNNVLTPAIERFEKAAEDPDKPDAVREQLRRAAGALENLRGRVQPLVADLQGIEVPSAYRQLREQLQGQADTIVVAGPDSVRVIPFKKMYQQIRQGAGSAGGGAQATSSVRFLGEERITGALLGLSRDTHPLVVFVNPGQRSAIGQRGRFSRVAERLETAQFEVEEWKPGGGGGRNPMQRMRGRGGGGQEPPEPEAGQRAVWILLPGGGSGNPMQRMRGQQGLQKAVSHVKRRLAAGDGAMILTSFSPMSGLAGAMGSGGGNPAAKLLSQYGIDAQTGKLVMRERPGAPNARRRGNPSVIPIESWPDDSPIGRAVGGAPGMFARSIPLKLGAKGEASAGGDANGASETARTKPRTNVEHWPLVRISGPQYWAESDMQAMRNPQDLQAPEGGGSRSFVLAAAAQKGETRVVAAGSALWASDRITGMGRGGLSADLTGAMFPGNEALFVNSVFWLAGLEDLIAAGARTQDIRRIASFSRSHGYALRWTLIAGMPLAVLGAGLAVWATRRR